MTGAASESNDSITLTNPYTDLQENLVKPFINEIPLTMLSLMNYESLDQRDVCVMRVSVHMYVMDKPSEGYRNVTETQCRKNTNQIFSLQGKLGF